VLNTMILRRSFSLPKLFGQRRHHNIPKLKDVQENLFVWLTKHLLPPKNSEGNRNYKDSFLWGALIPIGATLGTVLIAYCRIKTSLESAFHQMLDQRSRNVAFDLLRDYYNKPKMRESISILLNFKPVADAAAAPETEKDPEISIVVAPRTEKDPEINKLSSEFNKLIEERNKLILHKLQQIDPFQKDEIKFHVGDVIDDARHTFWNFVVTLQLFRSDVERLKEITTKNQQANNLQDLDDTMKCIWGESFYSCLEEVVIPIQEGKVNTPWNLEYIKKAMKLDREYCKQYWEKKTNQIDQKRSTTRRK